MSIHPPQSRSLANQRSNLACAPRWMVCCAVAILSGCSHSTEDTPAVSNELRAEAVAKLRDTMKSQERWVKVHAAEWLLGLGYTEGVKEEFQKEYEAHGDEPEYRIGIWRVLAKVPQSTHDSLEWVGKIKKVFLDETAPDRVHAAETLAKLRAPLKPDELQKVKAAAKGTDARLAAYCQWLLTASDTDNHAEHLGALCQLLKSPNVESRRIAAYAVRHLGPLDETNWNRIVEFARAASDPLVRVRLHGAALATAPLDVDKSERNDIRTEMVNVTSQEDAKFDQELTQILAEIGDPLDLAMLEDYLRREASDRDASTTADLSAAAANAILRIDRRSRSYAIHRLDWIVIAAYGLLMLGIGWYYSRRTKDREDYLLGSRTMRPWMVGLSLFATIISTISYLAYPGELIKEGPLVLASIFALPFVYVVVGWWLIPSLMNMQGASGYALLENKLGVGVRLLGATVFLLLRIIWMATIIYATANVALLPALGIDTAYSPLVCVILGCVTLAYTSMGGLRAVVLTDVIQSFILFAGAIIAVVLVTIHFGGFSWFPTSWPSHWQSPNYGLGVQERITVGNSIIFMLAWYICTCGSDQMAIQRFKATGGIVAARRTVGVSLVASFLVKAMLGLVGIAVMAYFMDQPHELPDKSTVLTNSDQMFPRFIVVGIPVGLTGLVIAGMLSAAMSSLSSGISAATSVISDDFIKRFRGLPKGDRAALLEERCISAILGAVVVALSLGVGYVPGNLFEITNRLVNALVAPLFVLFFMAMFVPRANSFSAVVGFLVSAAVAIAIAFFQYMNISMMWIVPSSMCVGIVAGCIASIFFGKQSESS